LCQKRPFIYGVQEVAGSNPVGPTPEGTRLPPRGRLCLDECQQIRIHFVFPRRAQPMWRPGIHLEDCPRYQFRRKEGRVGYRHDLVVIPMDDQCRHIEPFQVFSQVGLGESLDAEIRRRETGQHPLEPK